ncbi:hypothetical protein CGSHi22121_00107 [Haemophilus influenzae 22.1-21]|nr:hypothetical protein CGSHi22121_00107 [Haemophilus influenzae 22.1-21]
MRSIIDLVENAAFQELKMTKATF